MTSALVGLVGGILGLLIGSGYTFWSTRRSELAEALAAASALSEELSALARGSTESIDPTRLQGAWDDGRSSLARYLRRDDYSALSESVRSHTIGQVQPSRELIDRFDVLSRLFWEQYQAFILTPLLNYVRGRTFSKRLHDALMKCHQ